MVRKQDQDKARYWRATVREAARSGISIREFCRQRKLRESQFHWWRRRLAAVRPTPGKKTEAGAASFALVSDEPGMAEAGIELVLAGGRRLRIRKGVDEETLRAVLAAMGTEGC